MSLSLNRQLAIATDGFYGGDATRMIGGEGPVLELTDESVCLTVDPDEPTVWIVPDTITVEIEE